MSRPSIAAPLKGLKKKFELAMLRSVFVKVRPPPANLAERRAVLRALQRYADIEAFKKLADDSSYVSLAATSSAAQALVNRSPMKYEFITEKFDTIQPWGAPGITSPIEPIETSSPPDKSFKRNTDQISQQSFELHIFPSPNYKHKTAIRHGPLHGPWPRDRAANKETFVYNALRSVVPKGISAEAFCDWQSGGQLSDEARTLRSQGDKRELHVMDRQRRRRSREQSS